MQAVSASVICCSVLPALRACATVLTHLPKPFFAFVFVPHSSLKAAEPIFACSALQNFAGFTLPVVGGGVSCTSE